MAYTGDAYGPMRTICGVSEADESVGRVPYVSADRELLVKLSAVTGTVVLDVDLLALDVEAIVDGIAGATPKTLFDLNTRLAGRRLVPITVAAGVEQGTVNEWSTIDLTAGVALVLEEIICNLSEAAWVVPSTEAGNPGSAQDGLGIAFHPNLDLKIPAAGCRYIHYQAVNASNKVTVTLSTVTRV